MSTGQEKVIRAQPVHAWLPKGIRCMVTVVGRLDFLEEVSGLPLSGVDHTNCSKAAPRPWKKSSAGLLLLGDYRPEFSFSRWELGKFSH